MSMAAGKLKEDNRDSPIQHKPRHTTNSLHLEVGEAASCPGPGDRWRRGLAIAAAPRPSALQALQALQPG